MDHEDIRASVNAKAGPALVAGPASRALAAEVARLAGGAPISLASTRFPDGELHVKIDAEVRGRSLYLVQALSAPIGEHLIELGLIADAARRAGARGITALIPYLGYARQDRRAGEGTPIGAAALAALLSGCHLDRIVTVDVHAPAIEGFFSCPVDNLTAEPLLADAARLYLQGPAGADHLAAGGGGGGDGSPDSGGVVVAPDLGAAKLARRYAQHLGLPMAVVHKTRLTGNTVSAEQLVGDVSGRRVLLVDDMISTGATIAAAIDAVITAGARPDVIVAATHGVFSPGSEAALGIADIRAILVTDSLDPADGELPATLKRISLAPLLAEAVSRLHHGRPLAELLART